MSTRALVVPEVLCPKLVANGRRASCKVLTAYHRTSGQKVAVKAIPKVGGWHCAQQT